MCSRADLIPERPVGARAAIVPAAFRSFGSLVLLAFVPIGGLAQDSRGPDPPACLAAPLRPAATAVTDAATSDDAALALDSADALAIGEVWIDNRNVFDPRLPAEDRWLYRLANRLHRRTRVDVVCRQLLFAPGEATTAGELAESERLLRGRRYLGDAEIRPVAVRQGADGTATVDVEVVTRDVWTLDVGLGVGRSGGSNTTHFQLRDANVLGTGKSLAISRDSGIDRTETRLDYRDPSLLGSRVELDVGWSQNSDGLRRVVRLERPFFALTSRWGAGLLLEEEERVDHRYALGEAFDATLHQRRLASVWWGHSRGLDLSGRATRLSFGASFVEDSYAASGDSNGSNPLESNWVYPWASIETTEDAFREVSQVDQIGRTEDLFVGHRARLRLGLAARAAGSSRDALMVDGVASGGWDLGCEAAGAAEPPAPDANDPANADVAGCGAWWRRGTRVLYDAYLSGRATDVGSEDVRVGGAIRLLRRDLGRHLLAASLAVDSVSDLDAGAQLLLGGDSGLRGYPLRYQSGTSRLLLTLEQRFYFDWYPFSLFHVGAAVFADAGRTFGAPDLPGSERGWLRDVGLGLRLAPSRSSRANVIHFDLALPLDRADGIAGVQWLVKTHASF